MRLVHPRYAILSMGLGSGLVLDLGHPKRGNKMTLYSFTVSGVCNDPMQGGYGKRREFFWCKAYNEKQALAWAAKKGYTWFSELEVVCNGEA